MAPVEKRSRHVKLHGEVALLHVAHAGQYLLFGTRTDTIPNMLWRKLSPVMAGFSDRTHRHMESTGP
jgi:hypothetical protein